MNSLTAWWLLHRNVRAGRQVEQQTLGVTRVRGPLTRTVSDEPTTKTSAVETESTRMPDTTWPTRRVFLSTIGMASTAIAGCLGTEKGPETEPTEPTGTPEPTAGSESERQDEDLDLREANVIEVAVESEGDGAVRFDVTLFHEDAGEDGYANWWQVETITGTRLGRRELLHAHGTEPFTRSATVEVPKETPCVIIRGHDQTHGYGGQVFLANVATGSFRAVQQGSEPTQFSDSECP